MNFDEYTEMMRHYFPRLPIQTIRDAYKHHASHAEVRRYLDRIAGRFPDSAVELGNNPGNKK